MFGKDSTPIVLPQCIHSSCFLYCLAWQRQKVSRTKKNKNRRNLVKASGPIPFIQTKFGRVCFFGFSRYFLLGIARCLSGHIPFYWDGWIPVYLDTYRTEGKWMPDYLSTWNIYLSTVDWKLMDAYLHIYLSKWMDICLSSYVPIEGEWMPDYLSTHLLIFWR